MTKFRKNSKIKREHGMIPGLDRYLQQIEKWDEVQSILTGVITRRKGTSPFTLNMQYETDTGLKCLAKYQGSVQEVFLVCKDTSLVKQKLIELAKE